MRKPKEDVMEGVPAVILPGADLVSLNLQPGALSFKQFESYAKYVRALDIGTPWYIGELAEYADTWPYGQQVIAELWGLEEKRVYDYRIVAQRFPRSRRRPGLSWSHHYEMRYFQPAERADELLEMAEFSGWDTKTLRAAALEDKALKRSSPGYFGEHPERIPIKLSDALARTAPREYREITISTDERRWRDLVELVQRTLDAHAEVQRIASALDPSGLDSLLRALAASKDFELELIESLEHLGLDPI